MRSTAFHRMTTVDEIEAAVGRTPSMIMLKQVSALDEGCRTVLAHSPLAGFGYRDAEGVSRTTFVGGRPGFVRIHSPTRMSFTLPDGEAHGPVSFVFLLPGVGETLRVNGSVARRKGAETFVDVAEAYVHCAQSVIRSRLWQPPVPAEPAPEVEGEGPLCGPGVAEFLAAAPFLALSTWDGTGGSDTSPRGDRQSVARILDGRTLAVPDLSFAALVPGRAAPRSARRAYSASSAPGASRLEVTVKHVAGGRFSTHVHRNLRAGDRLSVRGPSGAFHVDPAAAHDVVLVAAGSGVTPALSMIRTLLAAPTAARIALLYSNRTEEDIIFAEELLRLEHENPERLSVTHVLTQQSGRLDAAGVHGWLTELRPAEDARYYTCGPEALMDTVRGVLTDLGVPDDRVHHERYTSGADPTATATAPQLMVIENGTREVGSVVVEPGQTLLDAGLAAGPADAVLVYVLTCVGCPLSKVILDIAEP